MYVCEGERTNKKGRQLYVCEGERTKRERILNRKRQREKGNTTESDGEKDFKSTSKYSQITIINMCMTKAYLSLITSEISNNQGKVVKNLEALTYEL